MVNDGDGDQGSLPGGDCNFLKGSTGGAGASGGGGIGSSNYNNINNINNNKQKQKQQQQQQGYDYYSYHHQTVAASHRNSWGVDHHQIEKGGGGGGKAMEMTDHNVFYSRNSSEELFLKSLMESSIGMPVPTMEMLGFKNLSHNFRADSEELFRSWLSTNGSSDQNQGHNSSTIAHRTRQASRRLSTEIASLSGQAQQQQAGTNNNSLQKRKSSDVLLLHDTNMIIGGETSGDLNQNSMRTAVERGLQASNLYLAKAWFHSSQPMTRSRSSELRKRYAAMQNAQTSLGAKAVLMNSFGNDNNVNKLKEEVSDANGFNDNIPDQLTTFMSPSNSSSSTFNQTGNNNNNNNVDKVSSVVSMLKGTLERKRLTGNPIENEAAVDHSCIMPNNATFNHGQGEIPGGVFGEVSINGQVTTNSALVVQGSCMAMGVDDLEGFINNMNNNPANTNTNTIQMSAVVSREASQSESSAAAPSGNGNFDACGCDGPSNSSQTFSICETSKKQAAGNTSRNSEDHGSKSKDFRERIIDNLKDERKPRGGLVRYGSVTSAGSGSVDRADPTKKRRVERSRKMAEAKERNSTPTIPSDVQAVLKRCETLEKEVRSLKLNLSFMNRKDSEQTKQIEELQKQNEELTDEKERLLEEIERIVADSGKM